MKMWVFKFMIFVRIHTVTWIQSIASDVLLYPTSLGRHSAIASSLHDTSPFHLPVSEWFHEFSKKCGKNNEFRGEGVWEWIILILLRVNHLFYWEWIILFCWEWDAMERPGNSEASAIRECCKKKSCESGTHHKLGHFWESKIDSVLDVHFLWYATRCDPGPW